MSFAAAAGIAGKLSLATSHSDDAVGQVDTAEVVMAPPLPVGLGVFL